MIIHGFNQNGRSNINRDLKNSYLGREDFNVIIVDWSSLSSYYYGSARYRIEPAGISVSRFLDFLNVNYTTLQVIGYDLGKVVSIYFLK